MTKKKFECKSLKWDTDYFGISSARINLSGVIDEGDQKQIIEFCNDYDFVTISNLHNIKENNYWIGTKTDSFLVDINIQFVKKLESNLKYENQNSYVVNKLPRNEQILNIAKNSFVYSRFFDDKALPEKQSRNIYVHWTESAFNHENKFFVINEIRGQIAGYILFSMTADSSYIELIAVDEKFQGKNIGSSLMQSLETFIKTKGIYNIKVGTQISNIPAAQFYLKMGYKYFSCSSTYHLWRNS